MTWELAKIFQTLPVLSEVRQHDSCRALGPALGLELSPPAVDARATETCSWNPLAPACGNFSTKVWLGPLRRRLGLHLRSRSYETSLYLSVQHLAKLNLRFAFISSNELVIRLNRRM